MGGVIETTSEAMPTKTEVAEPNLARFPAETAPNYRSANASPEQDTTQNINLLN